MSSTVTKLDSSECNHSNRLLFVSPTPKDGVACHVTIGMNGTHLEMDSTIGVLVHSRCIDAGNPTHTQFVQVMTHSHSNLMNASYLLTSYNVLPHHEAIYMAWCPLRRQFEIKCVRGTPRIFFADGVPNSQWFIALKYALESYLSAKQRVDDLEPYLNSENVG